ncbi:WD40-repeat-containing domain protein [Pelagophyceae sp. CCMP2097]|nr:WD40-repeat-containing domain protein [Pelagophyceae sp. CCMP2097]|mmetsp:Transcript_6835/g.22137  ORF Transcript_6835/g.22137 Transcript_6835/m.22137 type:complete len:322 (+) Transcript_6835:28-993(+)
MKEPCSTHVLQTQTTAVNPCAVDVCGDLALVATYELNEATKVREGGLVLYALRGAPEVALERTAALDVGGVLECAWTGDRRALAATADGRVVCVECDGDALAQVGASDAAGHLYMSIEWDPQSRTAAVAEANGRVSVWNEELAVVHSWDEAHTYEDGSAAEVWCAARRGDVVLSGADDAKLKWWDVRMEGSTRTLRSHGAGVTAVAWSPHAEHEFMTGSYDESVRVWDARAPRAPTSELDLGGGVWTLKYHAAREGLVVASCMRAGVCVLQAAEGGVSVVARYTGHEAEKIAYGADFHGETVASCSFYDRNVHLWRLGAAA